MQLNYGQLALASILANYYLILNPGNAELIVSLNLPRRHSAIIFLRLKKEELVINGSGPTGISHEQVQREHLRLHRPVAQTHKSSTMNAPAHCLQLHEGASQDWETWEGRG